MTEKNKVIDRLKAKKAAIEQRLKTSASPKQRKNLLIEQAEIDIKLMKLNG